MGREGGEDEEGVGKDEKRDEGGIEVRIGKVLGFIVIIVVDIVVVA